MGKCFKKTHKTNKNKKTTLSNRLKKNMQNKTVVTIIFDVAGGLGGIALRASSKAASKAAASINKVKQIDRWSTTPKSIIISVFLQCCVF
jgi:hypothetical protein